MLDFKTCPPCPVLVRLGTLTVMWNSVDYDTRIWRSASAAFLSPVIQYGSEPNTSQLRPGCTGPDLDRRVMRTPLGVAASGPACVGIQPLVWH